MYAPPASRETNIMEQSRPGKVPPWAIEPGIRFLDRIGKSHHFYHLAVDGIMLLGDSYKRAEELTAALEKLDEQAGTSHSGDYDKSRQREYYMQRASWAKRETEEGFPVLHQQAIVDLWSSLEVLFKDLVASMLENVRGATQLEPIAKMRIRLRDYESMSPRERYEYLVDELERELGAGLKQGIDRFEMLLAPFGLSGPIDEGAKKTLFELSNVRHVIVHRRAVADRKLTDACPWLGLKLGDQVRVTSGDYERYMLAAIEYWTILQGRLQAYFSGSGDTEPRNG